MNFDIELSLGGVGIVGIDEAGRGCLAGPVVAAAVILPANSIISGINDSKKLSPATRATVYKTLISQCKYAVGLASAEEIDQINILKATMLAMQRARSDLTGGTAVIIDGNANPFPHDPTAKTVIGGDAKSLTIAAASIIAKVFRDQLMEELHLLHPEYDWLKNKGYGTEPHRSAIVKHGPSTFHRRSFLRKLTQMKLGIGTT